MPRAVPQCVQSALTCHAYHFGVRFKNRRTLLVGALAVLVAGVVGYGLLHQSKPDERAGLTPGFKTYAPPALAGYQEPSLVFALGKDVLLTNGAGAADATVKSGGLALVEDAEKGAFLARLAELEADAAADADLSGFNYSRGKPVHITLYRVTRTGP